MSQVFVKGRTDNHLTWVMVDATDYATPESALSAALKIKVYGKLRADNTVYFVSSGTGSLTNDIKHVGASVLGIYTIGLVKADLSDASAAWYDQYIVSLSATGAAYQTLIVDGGIDASAISAYQSRLSDILSQVLLATSAASDAASAAVVGASRTLLVQSRLSDLDSRLASEFSDLYSQVSDFRSDLHSFVSTTGVGLHASALSDIRSAIAAGPAATVTASDISDIASAVWANTIGARVDSRVLLNLSRISDVYSLLSDTQSDFQSRVPKAVATNSQLSDLHSDLKSYLAVMSGIQSDVYSALSDFQSDFGSRVPKRVATDSQLSDLHSDLRSFLVVMSGIQSDLYSQVSDFRSDLHSFTSTTGVQLNASTMSDLRSAIAAVTVTLDASNISDIASAVVAALPITSQVSDIYSLLSQLNSLANTSPTASDIASATLVELASMISDLRSAIAAGPAATVTASDISDIASAVWANAIGTRVDSRVLVSKSTISDVYSLLSDHQSDFQSRVPKRVATDSQLSDLASDVKSAVAVGGGTSVISDIYSLLSDLQSDFQSRVPKRVATDSQLSDLASDVKSAVTANGASGITSDIYSLLSDFVSDFGSALAEPTAVPPAAATWKQATAFNHALNRNKITQTATVQSLRNDADAADICSAAVSDDGVTFIRGEFA